MSKKIIIDKLGAEIDRIKRETIVIQNCYMVPNMENEEIVERIQTGQDVKENMQSLYQQNKGFIYKLSLKYSGFMEMADLMQEAYIALNTAVTTYKPSEATFISWLGQCIKYHFNDVIRYPGAYIPKNLRRELSKYNLFRETYKDQSGEYPSDEVVKEMLNIDDKKLSLLRTAKLATNCVSIYTPLEMSEYLTISDIVPTEDIYQDIDDKYDTEQSNRIIHEELEKLRPNEQTIIKQSFWDGKTLAESGRSLNISRERARQIQKRALTKLYKELSQMQIFREEMDEYNGAYRGTLKRFNHTMTSTPETLAIRITERE